VRRKSSTTVAVQRCPLTATGTGAPVPVPGLDAIPVQIDPVRAAVHDRTSMPLDSVTVYTLRGCPDIAWGDRLVTPDGTTYLVRHRAQFGTHHLRLNAEAPGLRTHTCSILRRIPGATQDTWGGNTQGYLSIATNVPCWISAPGEHEMTNAQGIMTISDVVMEVSAEIDITPADRVHVNGQTWEVLGVVTPGPLHPQIVHLRVVQS